MIETTGLDEATVIAWMNAVWGPDSVQARAGMLGGALDPASGYMNTRAWRAAEFPAANMFTDARSLARMYAATVSEVDGVRLLESGDGRKDDRRPDRQDADEWAAAGTGYPGRPLLLHVARILAGMPADALGRAALVSAIPARADRSPSAEPDAGIGFSYVTNLWSFRIGEPRASHLAAAVVACLG